MSRHPRLTVDDVVGVVGIVPTPAKPGADQWNQDDTVDLEETARMTEAVIAGGVDWLLTNGTFGEGASLTWKEVLAFADTVLRVAHGRVPVLIGATTLNTRDSIARTRELMALGADGVFLGRPMWLALDATGIVKYYQSVAEAVPEAAIVVYDNPGAFKGKIPTTAYAELSRIPQIVASKHMGIGLVGSAFVRDLRAVEGRMRLLPLAEDWYYSARLFPEEVKACWSGDVACGPAPLIALKRAILSRAWEAAEAITEDIEWALETLFPGGDFQEFLKYSIQIDRAKFAAAGFIRPGPTRPPYIDVPEAYRAGGAEAGRRWAELQRRYQFESRED
jgi:4-(2-carboxyphenyl)-2-oxobut-3-enoate aldolase